MKVCSKDNTSEVKSYPLAEILIALYVIENVVGSSGRLLSFGSLSLRMVLFILCFVATLPALFTQLRSMVRNRQVIITCCFGVWLAICAVIGVVQNNNVGNIKADITSFLSLALLPGFLCVINTPKSVIRMMKTVYWAAFGLSAVTIVIHMALAYCSDEWINAINVFLNDRSLGGLALLNTGCYRVYMRSQIFIQVAIVYGIWLIYRELGCRRIWLMICEGVMLFAMLMTYTRGFWIGFFAAALIVLAVEWKSLKKLITVASVAGVVALSLLVASAFAYGSFAATQEIFNRFSPNIMVGIGNPTNVPDVTEPPVEPTEPTTEPTEPSKTDIENQQAVAIRSKTLEAILARIGERPIFGNGLGANLDDIREDGKVEYMYLDILLKTGCVGMLLFLITFFYPVLSILLELWKKRGKMKVLDTERMQITVIIASYISVAVTSWFNPYLSNPMGITLLMITSAAVLNKKTEKDKKGETL